MITKAEVKNLIRLSSLKPELALEAYKKDLLKAEIYFLDTGYFALETHHKEIAQRIIDFMKKNIQ